MQEHEKYDRDNDVRRDIESALKEYGYTVEGWSLTIKAVRNLRVEQQSLGLVQ